MAYFYLKALHIIFVVTWFAGMFYLVRLFIYNTEANTKPEVEKKILQEQFGVMMRRLLYGITLPSAILTLIFGISLFWQLGSIPLWLWIKLGIVLLLFVYHCTLHYIYLQQVKGIFNYTSTQLRIYNEVATVFLVSIVFLVVVKTGISLVWGLGGLIAFVIILMTAIKVYRELRGVRY